MAMKAIEFTTSSQDGTIKIPKKYQKDLEKQFRVIILVDETLPSQKRKGKSKQFKAMSIKTKGLTFDRDEANER